MYNFTKHLLPNEEIQRNIQPVPGKGGKNLLGYIFIIAFIGLMFFIFFSFGTPSEDGISINPLSLIFLVFPLFGLALVAIAIHGIVYTLFFKAKTVENYSYCITNKRVLKYNSKKDKLTFCYLKNVDEFYCRNEKDNYGDVYIGIRSSSGSRQDAYRVKGIFSSFSKNEVPFLTFESVENPDEVIDWILDAKSPVEDSQEEVYY